MNNGCETKPTARSVPAKQASSMLYMDCNRRLVFMAMITNAFIKMIIGHDPKFSAITGKVTRMYSQKYSSFATRQLAISLVAEELVKFIAAVWDWISPLLLDSFSALLMRRQCSLLKGLCYFQIRSAKLYMQKVKTCLIFKA